jgi:2-deoxy-D-gluconate 3-dehydrogenase
MEAAMGKLDGKTAIVTGGARGIGLAIAKRYIAEGARVVVADIDEAAGKNAVSELGSAARFVRTDVGAAGDARNVVAEACGVSGDLDILVNNAGIIRRAPFLEFSEKDWDDVMNLNIKAVFLLSQAAARQMVSQGEGGRIISVASMLSFQGGILVPSYAASKSAVMGLTRLMGCELGPKGINCNAIAPGYMATDNTKPLRDDPERNKAILDRIPLGRWGSPGDLKGLVVFLASEASAYINGYTIAVDGGWLAR